MSDPKRHHWWPQLQSGRWCAPDGYINVLSKDGKEFRGTPLNLGLEGQLYTLTYEDGSQDKAIETWFSQQIDTPFAKIFDRTFDLKRVYKKPFDADAEKRKLTEELGYKVAPYMEFLPLTMRDRLVISNYVASLLVRNPHYLKKLEDFHRKEMVPEKYVKNYALQNMLYLFKIYRKVVLKAEFMLDVRAGTNEYLFGDSGITASEPWNDGIPFDLHVPLTPDLALEVLPVPNPVFRDMPVAQAGNTVIARHNRAVIGDAKRFVFSRSAPPKNFILKYFGKPAPAPFGHRIVNGEVEVKYDRSRDHE